MKSIKINDMVFSVKRRTKHTLDAFSEDGIRVVSGPSIPKLTLKLQKLFPKEKSYDSIKSMTLDMILNDKEDFEIVESVQKEFPKSAFDNSHISWYRSTLYRDGIIEPKHAPRRCKDYKNWKKNRT